MQSEEDRGDRCERNIPESSDDAFLHHNEGCGESPRWLAESGKIAWPQVLCMSIVLWMIRTSAESVGETLRLVESTMAQIRSRGGRLR